MGLIKYLKQLFNKSTVSNIIEEEKSSFNFEESNDTSLTTKNDTHTENITYTCENNYDNIENTDYKKIIEVLNEESREQSDIAYNNHKNSYINLDFHNINTKPDNIEELTSTEKYFLKALSNKSVENLNLPGYWTYEYSINYNQIITKLIENGYIKIASSSEDLSFLTVTQLKDILKFFSLKVSGKKQELIERIAEHGNVEYALKSLDLYKERYILTSIGKQTVELLPESITKNLEFEDRCLSLILNRNYSQACEEVCIFRRMHYSIIERGLKTYSKFMETNISDKLPEQCLNYADQVKSCMILGNMLGTDAQKTCHLILRIIPNIDKCNDFNRKIYNLCFLLSDWLQNSRLSWDTLNYKAKKRDEIIPWILESAIKGFEQTEIYKEFPDDSQSSLQKVINELISKSKIRKVKKGNTYYIYDYSDQLLDESKFTSKEEEKIQNALNKIIKKSFTNTPNVDEKSKISEDEAYFFKRLLKAAVLAKLNLQLFIFEPKYDRTFNVKYNYYYIGKIKIEGKQTYMQITSEDDGVDCLDNLSLNEYILRIPRWINQIKYCLRNEY